MKMEFSSVIIVPVVQDFPSSNSITYVSDLVIDELALEFAWEGTRYGDLIRFARAMNDNDVIAKRIAKRIAGRDFSTDVSYRHHEFQFDQALYTKFSNEANWYLPLPADVVAPVNPDDLPVEDLPTVEGE